MKTQSYSERTKFVDPKIAVKIATDQLVAMGFYIVSKSRNVGTSMYLKRRGYFKKIRVSDHRDPHPNDDVGYDIMFLEKTMVADAQHRVDNVAKSILSYENYYHSRCHR